MSSPFELADRPTLFGGAAAGAGGASASQRQLEQRQREQLQQQLKRAHEKTETLTKTSSELQHANWRLQAELSQCKLDRKNERQSYERQRRVAESALRAVATLLLDVLAATTSAASCASSTSHEPDLTRSGSDSPSNLSSSSSLSICGLPRPPAASRRAQLVESAGSSTSDLDRRAYWLQRFSTLPSNSDELAALRRSIADFEMQLLGEEAALRYDSYRVSSPIEPFDSQQHHQHHHQTHQHHHHHQTHQQPPTPSQQPPPRLPPPHEVDTKTIEARYQARLSKLTKQHQSTVASLSEQLAAESAKAHALEAQLAQLLQQHSHFSDAIQRQLQRISELERLATSHKAQQLQISDLTRQLQTQQSAYQTQLQLLEQQSIDKQHSLDYTHSQMVRYRTKVDKLRARVKLLQEQHRMDLERIAQLELLLAEYRAHPTPASLHLPPSLPLLSGTISSPSALGTINNGSNHHLHQRDNARSETLSTTPPMTLPSIDSIVPTTSIERESSWRVPSPQSTTDHTLSAAGRTIPHLAPIAAEQRVEHLPTRAPEAGTTAPTILATAPTPSKPAPSTRPAAPPKLDLPPTDDLRQIHNAIATKLAELQSSAEQRRKQLEALQRAKAESNR